MPEELDMEQLRHWIGRREVTTDSITPELVRRFSATFSGYTPIADEQLTMAPGIHWCLAPPAAPRDQLGADGHPATGDFLPPVPLPRRMWASSRIQFHRAPCAGQAIDRTSTILDVVLKHGAASGPMVLVTVEHSYAQMVGNTPEILLEEQQTLVYRSASAFKSAAPRPPQASATVHEVVPNSVLLFRYSALTFNGHRIHYDQRYAREEEGYPGLVVQGPLMATLLMHMAQACRPTQQLQSFEFRGMAPAFADEALQLHVIEDNAESLAIRNAAGAIVMRASARFAPTGAT